MLFCGWGCYMILRNYYFQATENEVTDIICEKYPVFESVPEEQKSHPTTDMPYSRVTFVKPQVTNKLNNFLGVELSKEQDKTIEIDVDIPTSTPNSISMISNNMVKVSNINNILKSSPEDSVYDKEIMKNLMSSKISSTTEYTDKIINTNNNKDSVNSKFFEKLQNIAKSSNDFQWFENNYDFKDLINKDLIKDAVQDNHDGESSSRDRNDEQINTPFDSDLVICPPYQSYESSDMSPEHSIKDSSTSQAVSIPEFIEQIKNIYNNDGTENKDKHNTDDSNMLMSASSDVSMFGSNDYLDGFEWPNVMPNLQDYHSDYQSEITANVKQEEEKRKFMKNIESLFNFEFLQPKIQDSVDSSTSNDKFQWFNAPPVSANDLQLGLKDISESSQTQNPSLGDTIKGMNIINAFIPEKDKFHNKCQIEVKQFIMFEIFRINCSGTMFDEQWNLVPPPTLTTDSSNVINSKDIFGLSVDDYNNDYDKDESEQLKDDSDFIFNENFDKEVTSLQHSAPEVTDGITTSMPSLFDFPFKKSFNRTEIDKHDGIHSSNQEKIKEEISSSSTTIPSFTSTADSDFNLDFNTELQEIFDTLQTKKLKAIKDYSDYRNICSIFPQLCSIPPNSDRLHVNLKLLIRNHDNSY
ncbi:hypothetical protein EAG_01078 [Camponotus floridanus]|uniref:Aftiphilin n=2 Tax=Camponotus floridanus TaxID=104421 RepID=E2AB62_CAMFO|nr:hypothetical protein EAG_01078 [Camponotus floridanus]